jgi:hypothetical protein
VLRDVDLLSGGEPALKLLGQDGRGREAPDELLAALAALILAALVNQDVVGDVPIAARDDRPAVDVGQEIRDLLRAVGFRRAS